MSDAVSPRPCVRDRVSEAACPRPGVRDRVSETVFPFRFEDEAILQKYVVAGSERRSHPRLGLLLLCAVSPMIKSKLNKIA